MDKTVFMNIMAHSYNHFCSGKATVHSVYVELCVTVNYIKIFNVAQQCFYYKFMLVAKIKCM